MEEIQSYTSSLDVLRQFNLVRTKLNLTWSHLMLPKLVKHSLEVIKEYRVCHAFEDKSKLPEGDDASNAENGRY